MIITANGTPLHLVVKWYEINFWLKKKENRHYAYDRKHNVTFNREAFLMYHQFADGFCSNLTTMEVSCQMKIGRVSKKYKRLLIFFYLSDCYHRKKNFSAF